MSGAIAAPLRASDGARRFASLRAVALLGGGTAIGQAVALLSAPLLTRIYDVRAFGLLGLVTAVVNCIAAAATLRFEQAILLEAEESGAETVMRLAALVAVATSLLSLVAFALGCLTRWAAAAHLLLLFGPPAILGNALFAILNMWFVRHRRFRPLGGYQVCRSTVAVALQLAGAAAAPGAAMLVGCQTLAQGCAATTLAAADWRRLRRIAGRGWRWRALQAAASRYRSFALFGAPQSLLRLLATNLPMLLLPVFFGPAQSGLFWLAYRMLILPNIVVVESMRGVFFRRITELRARGGDLHAATRKMGLLIAALCLPVLPLLLLGGPALFAWVFGAAWRTAGHYAGLICIGWWLENVQMPSAVVVSVLELQGFYLGVEIASVMARALAIYAGHRIGSAGCAIGLYAAVWAATNLFVIAWVGRCIRADRRSPGR